MSRNMLFLAALTVFAGACAPNDVSVVITRFAAADTEPTMPGMACVFTPNGMNSRGGGLLDVGLASTFYAVPVVQNNLVATSSARMSETNGVFLSAFDVLMSSPDPQVNAVIPGNRRVQRIPVAGGYIPPGGGSQVAISMQLVSADVVTAIAQFGQQLNTTRPLLEVQLRPVVTHSGGSEIDGAYVTFPIEICFDCLLVNAGTCPIPKTGTTILLGGCFPGQDEPISCCTQSGQLLCGGAAPTM